MAADIVFYFMLQVFSIYNVRGNSALYSSSLFSDSAQGISLYANIEKVKCEIKSSLKVVLGLKRS